MKRRTLVPPVLLLAFSTPVAHAAPWQPSPVSRSWHCGPSAAPDAAPAPAPRPSSNVEPGQVRRRQDLGIRPKRFDAHDHRVCAAAAQHRRRGRGLPGGGWQHSRDDLEGSEVCDWLASRGITAVLLGTACRAPWWGRIVTARRRSKTHSGP